MYFLSRITTPVYRVITIQCISIIVVMLASSVLGWVALYSSFLGGLVCVLPELYLARQVLSQPSLKSALYGGFIGKLAVTVLLFIIIFYVVDPLNVMTFFLTLVVAQHVRLFSSHLIK